MKITLKDGSFKEYAQSMSVYEIALDISEGLARAACAGQINGKTVDLRTVVEEDCELNILTFNDEAGKAAYRHAASHVLAEAVKRLYPEAKLAIGPSIDSGFYYDFDSAIPFTQEILKALEAEMKKITKENLKLTEEDTHDYIREFYYDLKAAENVIEDITGKKTIAYAYPFGSVSKESVSILKCCGYKVSFGCEEGFNHLTFGDKNSLLKLRRFNRTPQRSAEQILSKY